MRGYGDTPVITLLPPPLGPSIARLSALARVCPEYNSIPAARLGRGLQGVRGGLRPTRQPLSGRRRRLRITCYSRASSEAQAAEKPRLWSHFNALVRCVDRSSDTDLADDRDSFTHVDRNVHREQTKAN